MVEKNLFEFVIDVISVVLYPSFKRRGLPPSLKAETPEREITVMLDPGTEGKSILIIEHDSHFSNLIW